jgi:hypothetical protein
VRAVPALDRSAGMRKPNAGWEPVRDERERQRPGQPKRVPALTQDRVGSVRRHRPGRLWGGGRVSSARWAPARRQSRRPRWSRWRHRPGEPHPLDCDQGGKLTGGYAALQSEAVAYGDVALAELRCLGGGRDPYQVSFVVTFTSLVSGLDRTCLYSGLSMASWGQETNVGRAFPVRSSSR